MREIAKGVKSRGTGVRPLAIDPSDKKFVNRMRSNLVAIRKSPSLYIMISLVILWAIVFHYIPIYGITIAFKKYSPIDGFWGGKWIGLKYVIDFVKDPYFFRLIRNTIVLGFMNIVFYFPIPIVFALLINELKNPAYKRVVQSLSYLPHFVAIVIVVGLMYQFFSYDGIITTALELVINRRIDFLGDSRWFRPLYVGSTIWRDFGWGSIMYLAAISSINLELYESAYIDGAGRFQRVRFITLPGIMPTVVVLFVLATRNIVRVGFEKAFLMQNPGIYETADVIATYVYRRGIQGGQFSYGTAIGLMNNIVSFIVVLTINKLARVIRGEGLW